MLSISNYQTTFSKAFVSNEGFFVYLKSKRKTMTNPLVSELLQEPHAYLII